MCWWIVASTVLCWLTTPTDSSTFDSLLRGSSKEEAPQRPRATSSIPHLDLSRNALKDLQTSELLSTETQTQLHTKLARKNVPLEFFQSSLAPRREIGTTPFPPRAFYPSQAGHQITSSKQSDVHSRLQRSIELPRTAQPSPSSRRRRQLTQISPNDDDDPEDTDHGGATSDGSHMVKLLQIPEEHLPCPVEPSGQESVAATTSPAPTMAKGVRAAFSWSTLGFLVVVQVLR